MLYALADQLAFERAMASEAVLTHRLVSARAMIGRGFNEIEPLADRAMLEEDGVVAFLLGMPLRGEDLDDQLIYESFYRELRGLPADYVDLPLEIVVVKALRPSEHAYGEALGVQGLLELARMFGARGDGPRNDLDAPPIVRVSIDRSGLIVTEQPNPRSGVQLRGCSGRPS